MTVRTSHHVDTKQIDGLDLTISFTMTVSEWRALREKLNTRGYEAHEVDKQIQRAIDEICESLNGVLIDPL